MINSEARKRREEIESMAKIKTALDITEHTFIFCGGRLHDPEHCKLCKLIKVATGAYPTPEELLEPLVKE